MRASRRVLGRSLLIALGVSIFDCSIDYGFAYPPLGGVSPQTLTAFEQEMANEGPRVFGSLTQLLHQMLYEDSTESSKRTTILLVDGFHEEGFAAEALLRKQLTAEIEQRVTSEPGRLIILTDARRVGAGVIHEVLGELRWRALVPHGASIVGIVSESQVWNELNLRQANKPGTISVGPDYLYVVKDLFHTEKTVVPSMNGSLRVDPFVETMVRLAQVANFQSMNGNGSGESRVKLIHTLFGGAAPEVHRAVQFMVAGDLFARFNPGASAELSLHAGYDAASESMARGVAAAEHMALLLATSEKMRELHVRSRVDLVNSATGNGPQAWDIRDFQNSPRARLFLNSDHDHRPIFRPLGAPTDNGYHAALMREVYRSTATTIGAPELARLALENAPPLLTEMMTVRATLRTNGNGADGAFYKETLRLVRESLREITARQIEKGYYRGARPR